MKARLSTDGGARGNPGPAAFGYVLEAEDGHVLAAQKVNASGDATSTSETTLAQLGGARRARARGYLLYRYANGKWYREPTNSPQQPTFGFTVAT